jgi:outer membrane protein assembly factor BamB
LIKALLIAATAAAMATACSSGREGAPPVPEPWVVPGAARQASPPERPLPRRFFEILDGDTGKPVADALIHVGRRTTATDSAGRAVLVSVGRGALRVKVTAPGYVAGSERIPKGSPPTAQVAVYRRDLQWPLYGANPARTQAHEAIKLRPPFRAVWQRAFGGLIEFPAVVWAGRGYVNTIRGYLTAFSMSTGRRIWRTKVGTIVASSPAVDAKRNALVTVSKSPGAVSIVDMDTGRIRWRYSIGPSEPSPLVRGRTAYLAGTNGRVYALDIVRRRVRWSRSLGAKITSSPALRGQRLYIGDYAGRVFALNAANGRVIWTGSAGTRVYGTVAVAGGRVFAPSVFSGLSALSAGSGRLLWRIPVGVYLYSSPAVYRGRVYFGTYAGRVYCASAASGRIIWSRSIGRRISGAVEVVDRVVYASTFGRTIGWDWRTGRSLVRFPLGEYVPVSGNGSTLLVHGHSRIWAVEPKRPR